jgi:hypothetical protein
MAYRASHPAADPPAALEWHLRSEKPLAFSVRLEPMRRARQAAMGALVVAVIVGGAVWLGVAVGHRAGTIDGASTSLSAGGCVLLYVLWTLGPVLAYQVLARFTSRLSVELDSRYFHAGAAPLGPSRAATREATAAIERFDVEASYLRDDVEVPRWQPGAARDGFRLVLRPRAPQNGSWGVRFDRREHAEFLADRMNAELAAIASQSAVDAPEGNASSR